MPLLVPLSAFAFTSFNGYLQCKSLVESAAYAPDYHYGPQFVFGTVLFLCGMLTWHLGNYPVKRWPLRAGPELL